MKVIVLLLVALLGCPSKEEVQKQQEDLEKDVNLKIVKDAMDQFQIVSRGGDKMEICVHAGMVSAALVQAKDQEHYASWKPLERKLCKAAGM